MKYSISSGSLQSNLSTYTNTSDDTWQTIPFKCSYLTVKQFPNGSTSVEESQGQQDMVEWLCHTKSVIGLVFFWLAIGLGIPGNLAAFATLLNMPKTTCTFYIALLSLLDLIAIVIKMAMRLLDDQGVRIGDVGCKIVMMVLNFIVTYANWVLVLICLERFVTIRFPLKKHIYFTIRRARYSALSMGCILFPIFIVVLFIYEAAPSTWPSRTCRKKREYRELSKIWEKVVTVFYSFAPCILLFFLVALISLALRHHKKRREKMWADNEEQTTLRNSVSRMSMNNHHCNQRRQMDKLERSVTGMLLVAAIVFLHLTLPICILLVMPYDVKSGTPVAYARYLLMATVARVLTLMSHALNCYIYFLTCKKFRRRLFDGITKICTSKSRAANGFPITELTPTH